MERVVGKEINVLRARVAIITHSLPISISSHHLMSHDHACVPGRHVCSLFATGGYHDHHLILELPILEAVIR